MSPPCRWAWLAAALLVFGAAVPSAMAGRARVTVVKSVSGATPFPSGCGSSISYQQGSEAEPSIAVNPRHSSNIVIIHQQDRALAAGSLANVLRVSTNGGRSWRRVALPGASPCYGADLPPGASDPWVSIGLDDVASWRKVHVGGPFDALTAAQVVNPQASGRFLGEYQGLAPLRRGFAAAFTMARPRATAGQSDVFFARIEIGR